MPNQATAFDLPFYTIFVPQKLLSQISDYVIACGSPAFPPIKNPGYAYALNWILSATHSSLKTSELYLTRKNIHVANRLWLPKHDQKLKTGDEARAGIKPLI